MHTLFHGIWKRLIAYFLAGVFAILPIVITVGIVIWVANFLEAFVGPRTWLGGLLTRLGGTLGLEGLPSTVAYVIGWVLVLAVVFALGVFIEVGAKAILSRLMDALFERIPLVGSIYNTSKQVVQMLNKSDADAMQGMTAVYCFFGEEPAHAVLALLVSPERYPVRGHQYQIVIIPTAPVPFGGAMLLVPVDRIKPAEMSVDGVMSIYLSMGVSAPQYITDKVAPVAPRAENEAGSAE
jgi:uncharacterized membrane protein